jgi:hypothetical protein
MITSAGHEAAIKTATTKAVESRGMAGDNSSLTQRSLVVTCKSYTGNRHPYVVKRVVLALEF